MPKIQEIYDWLDAAAPFASAMEWDNVGLLIGSPGTEVTGCLTALDATPRVAAAAAQAGANLIVTHHPVIFQPLRFVSADSVPARLIRSGIAVLSAHTNLDLAAGGVNDALCAALGFSVSEPFPNAAGLGRIISLPEPIEPKQLAALARERLGAASVAVTAGGAVRRAAVVSGAGGEYWEAAAACADALITGEAKYHELVAAANAGFPIIAVGHYHTEAVVLEPLAKRLSSAFPGIRADAFYEYPVCIL